MGYMLHTIVWTWTLIICVACREAISLQGRLITRAILSVLVESRSIWVLNFNVTLHVAFGRFGGNNSSSKMFAITIYLEILTCWNEMFLKLCRCVCHFVPTLTHESHLSIPSIALTLKNWIDLCIN